MSAAAQLQEESPQLLQDDANGVRTLTLNRPASRNALSDSLIADLHDALNAAAADVAVRVVVLAAAGPVFCAGHDLREMRQKSGLEDFRKLFRACADMMTAVVRLPKPVIAEVRGMATAAGCQLACSCDIVLASESARFATPGVHIGLFCSTPMVALSRKVGNGAAMEMLLTGNPVDAVRAREVGIANAVCSESELTEKTRELAEAIAAKSPLTLAIGKEAFYRQAEMPLEQAYEFAAEAMAKNMIARDAREGVDAFLGKRKPVWTGE